METVPPLPAVVLPFRRISFLRFIHDRNPFYLLSALCMFVGYRIVLAAVDSPPGDLRHLLWLIATLNIYEALLIALALFLMVRRGLARDGWLLLTIDSLFLVDLTNLNAEFFTANQSLGSIVSGLCFVLATAKIFAVMRTLGFKLSAGTALYVAMQLAFLFGLPGIFELMSFRSAVTPLQIYGIWWVVALLVAAGTALVSPSVAALPFRLYVVVPFISLIIHLASENRVYWVHFHVANVAPVLLAIAAALTISGWIYRHVAAPGSVLAVVVLAVCVSIMPQEYENTLDFHVAGCLMSPLRLALIAMIGITAWLFVRTGWWLALQMCCASGGLALLGANESQMKVNAMRLARWAARLVRRTAPTTALEWGYITITAAFVLLGVGAVFSLRKSGKPIAPGAWRAVVSSADNPKI